MSAFQPARAVHPDHVVAWGEFIGDPILAQRIMANPRLKARAAERVAVHYGIDPHGDLPVRAGILHSVNAVIANRDRMVRVCGLLYLRGILHRTVDRASYQALVNHVPHDELEFAASLIRDLPKRSAVHVDPERIGDRVSSAGEAVLATWYAGLDVSARRLLDFAFGPDAFGEDATMDAEEAFRIVELAARSGSKRLGGDRHA